ncbi:Vitamin B12 transporter BtuB [bioreactor metagenome]|uniref:Vitamin B12 transporter BtuB n=1 Tax=bioreactor metagenome TaxID=1076179 RepID=A0A644ZHG9_9ZZZZ
MMPLKKGDFRLSFWAGSQFNESPASLLSPQLPGNESQTSRFIRLSGFLPIISTGNAGLQMRFFFSADTFLYVNKQLAISDGTATQSFAMRWNGFIRTSGGHEFSAEYYPGFNRVASANFDNIVFCTDQRLRLKYQLNRTEVFKISFWNHFLNRDFENVFLLPGASVGFIPRNMSSKAGQRLKWLSVYAGLARNMRMPTMNDLYWAPGGNPDLKPEDAWMADMTVFASFAENKCFKWDVKWMPYYSTTTNLIRWTPDSLSSQWNASNVAESRQYGFEATATATFQWSKNSLSGSLNAARVFAEDVSGTEIKTLIYVPDKTMNAVLSIRHGIWSGGYEFHYTGKRFTDGDNDRYMPEIFLHDVFVCVSRNLGSNKLSLSARLNNFMNADYQYIAWYPMPRRNFYVTLKWNWNE